MEEDKYVDLLESLKKNNSFKDYMSRIIIEKVEENMNENKILEIMNKKFSETFEDSANIPQFNNVRRRAYSLNSIDNCTSFNILTSTQSDNLEVVSYLIKFYPKLTFSQL